MKFIFSDEFYPAYAEEPAAGEGRMEPIIKSIKSDTNYQFVAPYKADYQDIIAVHDADYINKLKAEKADLYHIAELSAGGAIRASEFAMSGEPAFAAIRPPGHHAYKNMSWGYCYLCNMAIALTKLFDSHRIESAFVLDFDAHTGDGTIDCLKHNKNIEIFNPMAEKEYYMKSVEDRLNSIEKKDIVAVCAGFDSYEKDCGGKLSSFDFYSLGWHLKNLSKKWGHHRRFAILEGGYYLEDLGKNVLAFCQGFE
jgi:acetoin utilization deacetylase AcuC-like enzyme